MSSLALALHWFHQSNHILWEVGLDVALGHDHGVDVDSAMSIGSMVETSSDHGVVLVELGNVG
jgi:hypothetical protein